MTRLCVKRYASCTRSIISPQDLHSGFTMVRYRCSCPASSLSAPAPNRPSITRSRQWLEQRKASAMVSLFPLILFCHLLDLPFFTDMCIDLAYLVGVRGRRSRPRTPTSGEVWRGHPEGTRAPP